MISIFLRKIKFKSYRSFNDETIDFDNNITCIVGPNDSGKTNLLIAINSLLNPQDINKDDVCCFSKEYGSENSPTIIYYFDTLSLKFNGEEIPNEIIIQLHNKKIEILEKVYGTIYDVEIFNSSSQYRLSLPQSYIFKKYKINSSIAPRSVLQLKDVTPNDLEEINHFKSPDLSVKFKKFKYEINDEVLKELIDNLKIKFWKFKEEEIKNIFNEISYNEFKKKPQKFPYICELFKKSGLKLDEFFNVDDTRKRNLLVDVNKYISKLIKEKWPQKDLEFRFDFTPNNSLKFDLYDNDKILELNKRGDGFRWFFKFLLNFSERFSDDIKNNIILLDEPGDFLHPGAQKLLLELIEDLAINNQIIYTTHSPFMINRMFPERIIHFKKKEGVTEISKPKKEGIFDDILISSTLGYDFTGLYHWGEINIFVEGITDKLILEKVILEKAKTDGTIILNLNNFSLLPLNGVNNLENFIRVAQETRAKYLAFLDNDDEAKEYTKKYTKRPKEHPNTINHIISLDNSKSLEDYIPISILNEALKNLKNKATISYSKFINQDENFDDELREQTIKDIVKSINNNIKKTNDDKIEKGIFKLDLMLEVKELISEKNINDFNPLIEKIKLIMNTAENLYYN